MPLPPLPHDVWTQIIQQCLLESKLSEGLVLRCVNSQFNNEVLRQLFVISIKDLRRVARRLRVPRKIAFLQLQGFFSKRVVPLKSQRKSRKTIFRAISHDPDRSHGVNNACFAYRPHQECLTTLVGPSSSANQRGCNACDMMNAMISVFGSRVFGFGAETDEDYDGCLPKDVRYWRALMACQRDNLYDTRESMQDFISDETLEEGKVASVFCDCFLIATRMNYSSMITMLHEEAKDREDVSSKLGKRQDTLNCLAEAIRLGHCDVFERLLKWKWKFNHTRSDWSYMAYVKLILDGDLYLVDDGSNNQKIREKLLRTMLDWTENWRNIAEMKEFLVKIGKNHAQWALQAAVDSLRSQHHFRHERGEEGSFTFSEPLGDIAATGNLDLLKLYFDNQHLLLPHTTAAEHMRMRRLVICDEFDREGEARVDVLKMIVEHSQDLLEQKCYLQNTLIEQFDKKLETWAWLAKKVGLSTLCEDHNDQTLGSVMLGLAVSKLNVETVRFLVNNGVQLAGEASTFQVYEDDAETMKRLLIVRELLGKGGQGAVRERRVIETTFLPINITKHRRRLSDMSIKSKSATKAGPASAAAKAAYACPRFLRRSLGSASKPTFAKSARANAGAAGESGGSSPPP